MFEIPSRADVSEVVITVDVIAGRGQPRIIRKSKRQTA
jgi:ATP-dependent protease Clp ATPase subunit